jgi:hypothetical protein
MIRLDKENYGNDENTPISNKSHNRSKSDEISNVVNQIEQSQLEHSVNAVKINYEDPKLPIYGKTDAMADGMPKADPEFPKYVETQRFSKEHSIDEQEIRSKTASKPKFATDDIRDGHKGA